VFTPGGGTQNLSNRAYCSGYNPKSELYRVHLRSAKSIFFEKDKHVRAACTHPVVRVFF
jgi:hypothetical protein